MTINRKITTITLLYSLFATSTFAGHADTSSHSQLRESLVNRYGEVKPLMWGEQVTGVRQRLKTSDKLMALTFDACGSAKGMGFDRQITDYLEKEQIPATLFINGRWIEPNRREFNRLAANPLFEIANHGLSHKPASVNGKAAYGINGTRTVAELVDEIELNAEKIRELTGKRPRFFRSGTAFYDEVAVKIAGELGHQVAGFSLLGDAGATYSREQVKKALLGATSGSIAILHFNHPESGTAAGLKDALPELKKRGFRFVRLSDVELE